MWGSRYWKEGGYKYGNMRGKIETKEKNVKFDWRKLKIRFYFGLFLI
jgi:hypothetical protein